MLKDNSIILFQGDSITDAGRTCTAGADGLIASDELGTGYPYKIKEYLDSFFADKNITVLNRGISGNRAIDLKNRWDKDCIELKPDYLSILIGINDTWRRYDSNNSTTAEEYEANYRFLLERATTELNCKIIILEPFIIPINDDKNCWYEDLMPKIQAARKLAREYDAAYIPLDGIFAANCIKTPACHLSQDGVHPTDAGHSLIARLWLDELLKG